MKIRFFVLALAVSIFTLQSCDELLNGIPVTLSFEESFTIGATPQGTFILEETVEPKADEAVATVGLTLEDIQSIVVNSLKVSIADAASGQDLSAFDRVSVILVADGLDEVVIASKELNGSGEQSVDIDVSASTNLADYLKKSEVTYKLEMETNKDIVDPIDVKVTTSATITAQLGE